MASSPIDLLRDQLRAKFPQAHELRPSPAPTASWEKPIRADEFPLGRISELIPAGPCAGINVVFAALLGDPSETSPHPELALVDGADGFDPSSFTGAACSRMLWVRCSSALEMIGVADLLVHDGNIPLVLLDATGLSRRNLSALPASAWWRLNQTVERMGVRLVVMAPFHLVPCANLQLSLSADLSLGDFDHSRDELVGRLRATSERLRHAT